MRHRLPLLLSVVALLVAVVGSTPVAGAVGGALLPARSVGSEQLRPHAVTSAKIRNGSVTALDVQKRALTGAHVRDGSLLAADFRAGQMPAGPKGDKGDSGTANVVFRRGQASLSAGGLAAAVAPCAPGERLLGGGAAVLRAGDTLSADPKVAVLASYPAADGSTPPLEGETASRWVAVARADEPSSTRIVAFAACAKP
jgi:hypothetical protein